jgi:catechol 2,3-dioxygenase-like lactoylglutathione lyase family enzyme
MALDFQVSMDCADPHAQCDFWAAALGYRLDGSDPAFIRRMISEGFATDDDTFTIDGELRWKTAAACSDPGGVRPRLYFQLVPEGKVAKNRVHLDLRVTDRAAEVDRLTALGARKLHDGQQGPQTWVVMADPEGNEFCVS